MRAWLVSFGIGLQLVAAAPAHALDGQRRVTQYAQTHFAARDGMPLGQATAIVQTGDGYLWTGSEEGLSRFDGAAFTTFDHRKTEGVLANNFTALAVDRLGTLWAGTRDHGVLHAVGGGFQAAGWEPNAQDQQVRALAFDGNDDLWIGMRDRGLVRLHGGVLAMALTTHDGLPSDDVRAFLVAPDGAMWIGTFRGLARWKAGRIARGPAALDGVAVEAIAQDAHGELWCATDKGLAHVRGDAVEFIAAAKLPETDIRTLLFDHDGNLWIGTGSGVARMTPRGDIERLPHPDVLILALFEDNDGNLWIGSERGLDRLRDGDVVPFGASEGYADDVTLGFREDPQGNRWFTTSGGLYRVAPGETTATQIVGDHGAMYAIYADSHGDVWFGGRNGDVGRWHDGRFTWLGKGDRWERVRAIAETAEGLWLGTDHGLFRMRGDRLSDAERIVPGVAIHGITPDAQGSLWLATDGGGLMRWRGNAQAPIPPGGPPRNLPPTTIVFDPDGTMWVGTEGAGLWRLRDGHWFVFTAKDGMFDDLMWRILDDGLGNLWMSSNRGIWRVSRQQLEARAAGLRALVDSVLYGEADGMRDRECNGAIYPAGWRAHDGRLWFPTGKGLAIIDPAHLHPARPPGALVESLRVNGHPQRIAAALDLAPGSTRLELGLSLIHITEPTRLRCIEYGVLCW
jgi:ligand-binding sensor domain-containing protein